MILLLWAVLLALSLILLIAGYFLDAPEMALTGYSFLFIMGILLLSNNVEVLTGVNETTAYTYTGNLTNTTSTITTNTYIGYTGDYSRIIGLLLMVVGVAGFAVTLISFKGTGEEYS